MDGNGCIGSDAIYLSPSSSQVVGNVLVDGADCVACEVSFLKYDPEPGLWLELMTTTNSLGEFDFGTVDAMVDFRLMVDPDNDVYPNGLQTYYAGTGQYSYRWEESASLNTGCATLTDKTIEVIQASHPEGECTFQGRFVHYNGPGKLATEEDPIPLIDVVVEKTPPGSPQARVTTNANGEFEFNFMPADNGLYTFYINYPGVPMLNNYEITVDPGDTLYKNLEFCLNEDSTEIEICLLSSVPEQEPPHETGVNAYPVPSSEAVTVLTGLFSGTQAKLVVSDALGRVVLTEQHRALPNSITIRPLARGLYLLRLSNAHGEEVKRLAFR
jgi:hypothetical protein